MTSVTPRQRSLLARLCHLAGLAGALGALLAGCGTSGSASLPRSAGPDAAHADEAHIVAIYRNRCGSCHRPVAPGSEPLDKLHAVLVVHRKRTRLTEREWSGIETFLSTAASATPPR
jgi:mono/diheme cytochrome c family protein